MRPFFVHGSSGLKGEVTLPGDKSIAHRSIIVSSLSCGLTVIENFPASKDCLTTLNAFKKLGLKIRLDDIGTVCVFGKGLHGLKRPAGPIGVGESGNHFTAFIGYFSWPKF